MKVVARILLVVCGLWLAARELSGLGLHWVPTGSDKWVHLVVLGIAAILCIARAATERRERAAWLLIGLGIASWAAGDLYFTIVLWDATSPPALSPADAGYILFYPLVFTGVALLLRSRVRGISHTVWVDGITSALAVSAVSAAIVVQTVLANVSGDRAAIFTNLIYPLGDLALLSLIVAGVAACGWRVDRTLALMIAGILIFWAADSLYVVSSARGEYLLGAVTDPGWWIAAVLFAVAAWRPPREASMVRVQQSAGAIAVPIAFATVGLGVLVVGSVGNLNGLAIGLASASVAAVMTRLAITFRENVHMLAASRQEALTDSLTGLGNRRALTADLEQAFAAARDGGAAVTLALYDLDGFKNYNDDFGHPAGDALLQRLGESLAARVSDRGRAYRMGGDEFCVLASPPDDVLVAGCANALSEHGEGFSIGCSYGMVDVPTEAADVSEALGIADQRLYAHKGAGRATARHETKDVMLRILAERDPLLGLHLGDVADLAEVVAVALGLGDQDVERVRHAAELHDIGKVAIPDAILTKPGPLTDGEWEFVRRHTIIGERILSASTALAGIGPLVRASHERWDGGGYPDALAGEDIPLGARIVAVCDAYDAMTKGRPHRPARTPQAALDELRACSGTQFDPGVVTAFTAAVQARRHVRAA